MNESNTKFLQHWSRVRGRGFTQYNLLYDVYGLMIGLGVALLGPLIKGTSYELNELTHWFVPPVLGCAIMGGLVGAVRWIVKERRYRALSDKT